MKKAITGVIVVIILIVGGILIFHKSPTKTVNSSSNSPSNNTSSKAQVPAVNNSVVLTKTNSSLGQYLTDPSGRALYTYNADTSGTSNCTGSCLTNWPAYQDTGSTSNLPSGISTIKRTDNGQIQYTYNGMPLYYFVSDSNGQVTGNGVENFSVATPSTASTSNSTSSGASSNSSSSGYPY